MKKLLLLTLLLCSVFASAQVTVTCSMCGSSGHIGEQDCPHCSGMGYFLFDVPKDALKEEIKADEYVFVRDVNTYAYNPYKDKYVKARGTYKLYLHRTERGIELSLNKSWPVYKCIIPHSDHFTFYIHDVWGDTYFK